MKSVRVNIRLEEREAAILRTWADRDPGGRGVGAVIRRLIHEEVERERRQREQDRFGVFNDRP